MKSLVYLLAKYLPSINHLQKCGAQCWNGEQLERQASQSVGSPCGQRGREHNPSGKIPEFGVKKHRLSLGFSASQLQSNFYFSVFSSGKQG